MAELEMRPVTYSLQFRGTASHVAPGVLSLRARAPGGALTTSVDDDGVHGHFVATPGAGPDVEEEALLEARMVLSDDAFEATGSINFGPRHAIRFRTRDGRLEPTPDRHLRQGTASAEVEGGTGQFANARGRFTSNFFLSDTGELTDHQLGLVFIGSLDDPNRRTT